MILKFPFVAIFFPLGLRFKDSRTKKCYHDTRLPSKKQRLKMDHDNGKECNAIVIALKRSKD